jgi:hypothetical protein
MLQHSRSLYLGTYLVKCLAVYSRLYGVSATCFLPPLLRILVIARSRMDSCCSGNQVLELKRLTHRTSRRSCHLTMLQRRCSLQDSAFYPKAVERRPTCSSALPGSSRILPVSSLRCAGRMAGRAGLNMQIPQSLQSIAVELDGRIRCIALMIQMNDRQPVDPSPC